MSKNEYIVRCPRCGTEFPEREKFCPHCSTPNRKMICRSCGKQINARDPVCKFCGAKNRRRIDPLRIGLLAAVPLLIVLLVVLLPKKSGTVKDPSGAQMQAEVSTASESSERSTAQDAPVQPEPQDTSGQSSQSFDVEKHSGTLFSGGTVEITIPSDYIGEDVTQDELDAKVEQADGFKSATLNADGSVTYIMTESCHKKLMQDMAEQIDSSLADIVGSADYPSVTAIDSSDDYTKFTVTLSSDAVSFQESIMALAFYMSGGLYHYFSTGEPVDNINVRFVDQSGNLLQEANSKDIDPYALSSDVNTDVSEAEPPAETTSPDLSQGKSAGKFVASSDSDKFHKPNCQWAKKILSENEILFDSSDDAIAAGYGACGTCHPK